MCSAQHWSFYASPRSASWIHLRLPVPAYICPSSFTSSAYLAAPAQLKITGRLTLPSYAKLHSTRFLVEACDKKKGNSAGEDPAALSNRGLALPDALQNRFSTGIALMSFGFLVGPWLDGIHSNVQLQIYDKGAIDIGFLHTNIVVPPLLAIFYIVVGTLQLALDKWLAPKGRLPNTSIQRVVLSFVFLIIFFELSAEMYKAGVPYNIESYVLFALAELNWVLFDGTWWGFALAVVVGIGCPLSEIPLMKFFNLWHYPKANVDVLGEGLVSWVLTCYFTYTPFLANLSRWFSLQFSSQKSK